MRKVALSACVLLITFASAQAQDIHPDIEVFGGISYLKADLLERKNFYGWGISVARNLNRHIGFVAEVSGNYGHVEVPPRSIGFITIPGFNEEASYHTFLFGPRVSSSSDTATLFGHVLIGGVKKNARSERNLNINIPDINLFPPIIPDLPGLPDLNSDPRLSSDTGFALGVGGGVDIKAGKRTAVRLFQVDYLPARLNDRWERNLRIQAGIIFRFGRD